MATFPKSCAAVFFAFALVPPAAAYDHPLTSGAIRDAYFLGQRKDTSTADFLSHYVRRFRRPKTGPHVAEIELTTPFAQVVRQARTMVGYSAQDAEQQYLSKPEVIRVRVRIDLTPTYPAYYSDPSRGQELQFRGRDFWRDFTIRLVQEGEEIAPESVSGEPLYLPGHASAFVGAEVKLEFSAEQVASEQARVEVVTPDGRQIVARFDLTQLR